MEAAGAVTTEQSLKLLREAHDAVKEHPYRLNFSQSYEQDYMRKLMDLSSAWSRLVFDSDDMDDKDRSLLIKFYCGWAHNWNAMLIPGKPFPKHYLQFYEAMLNVTHRYLDTGCLDSYCAIAFRRLGSSGSPAYVIEWYDLLTFEQCGIRSPELPRYLPRFGVLCEDEEKVLEDLLKRLSWKSREEVIEGAFSDWKKNVLPLIKYHNKQITYTDENGKRIPQRGEREVPVWESL